MKGLATAMIAVSCIGMAGAPLVAADDALVGTLAYYRIQGHENLLDVARSHDLGYIELVAANPGIDPWLPDPGRTLLLPKSMLLPMAPHKGIVINLPELRLYYFGAGPGLIATYPIGIGREGWETPTGRTDIARKAKNPAWVPPESIRAAKPYLPSFVPPGPDNPLGAYALYLGWPSYLIHGTNRPYGVGRRVSSGCIRLYPEDIETLFAAVEVGTTVAIVDQPVKLGWSGGQLYLEAHPDLTQADRLEMSGWFPPTEIAGLEETIRDVAGDQSDRIVWAIVHDAVLTRRGVPVRITQ